MFITNDWNYSCFYLIQKMFWRFHLTPYSSYKASIYNEILSLAIFSIIFLWGAWNGGDSESPDFLHQISIYTDIIESPNLQYLNMQIIKSPGSKWKNPHPHFFQNPQISRF